MEEVTNSFGTSLKTVTSLKLIKTYESLKQQVEQHQPKTSKITMGMVRPLPQTEYLLNVVLYTDVQQAKGQKPWNGLYMMFPTDPHRQYQVKAPKNISSEHC